MRRNPIRPKRKKNMLSYSSQGVLAKEHREISTASPDEIPNKRSQKRERPWILQIKADETILNESWYKHWYKEWTTIGRYINQKGAESAKKRMSRTRHYGSAVIYRILNTKEPKDE